MTRLGTSHRDWKKEAGQIYLSSSARDETTKLEKSGLPIFTKHKIHPTHFFAII